jgi:hypothetical protein
MWDYPNKKQEYHPLYSYVHSCEITNLNNIVIYSRYIICKWKRKDCDVIADYLYHVNEQLWKFGSTSDNDIVEVVPLEVLTSDDQFFNYIVNSNNR